jgi:hypothetical protein
VKQRQNRQGERRSSEMTTSKLHACKVCDNVHIGPRRGSKPMRDRLTVMMSVRPSRRGAAIVLHSSGECLSSGSERLELDELAVQRASGVLNCEEVNDADDRRDREHHEHAERSNAETESPSRRSSPLSWQPPRHPDQVQRCPTLPGKSRILIRDATCQQVAMHQADCERECRARWSKPGGKTPDAPGVIGWKLHRSYRSARRRAADRRSLSLWRRGGRPRE